MSKQKFSFKELSRRSVILADRLGVNADDMMVIDVTNYIFEWNSEDYAVLESGKILKIDQEL